MPWVKTVIMLFGGAGLIASTPNIVAINNSLAVVTVAIGLIMLMLSLVIDLPPGEDIGDLHG